MSDERGCGVDAAAYAMGSLDPGEADAFRAHMATCSVCQDELAAFQQVVDALPMGAPQHRVPRGLRRSLMRRVRAEPRTAAHRAGPSRLASSRSWLGFPRFSAQLLAGAGTVAVAAVVLTLALSSGGRGQARVVRASVVEHDGSAELRISGEHAQLVVRHLPPPPAGHIYEVWLVRGRRPPAPTSALFSVTSTGAGDVEVPGSLHGVSDVLVTPEPDGGSLRPTHAPVIVARLS